MMTIKGFNAFAVVVAKYDLTAEQLNEFLDLNGYLVREGYGIVEDIKQRLKVDAVGIEVFDLFGLVRALNNNECNQNCAYIIVYQEVEK